VAAAVAAAVVAAGSSKQRANRWAVAQRPQAFAAS